MPSQGTGTHGAAATSSKVDRKGRQRRPKTKSRLPHRVRVIRRKERNAANLVGTLAGPARNVTTLERSNKQLSPASKPAEWLRYHVAYAALGRKKDEQGACVRIICIR